MSVGAPLDAWRRSEDIALQQAHNAAGAMASFCDPSSKFFQVSLEAGTNPRTPLSGLNSATCQIANAMERCDSAEWKLDDTQDERPWMRLRIAVKQSYRKTRRLAPDRILPLNTFGMLPIFSSGYAAQYLANALPANQLTSNVAYCITIRRLVGATFNNRVPKAPSSAQGLGIHPFVIYHVYLALQQFQELDFFYKTAASLILQRPSEELWDQVLMGFDKTRAIEERDKLASRLPEFKAVIEEKDSPPENAFKIGDLASLIDASLAGLEEIALRDAVLEIAKSARQDRVLIDPSALAFGLLTLIQTKPKKYASLIAQGLSVLMNSATRGHFPFGRPFLSDGRGRSLTVPSVEVANSALIITLKCAASGILTDEEVSRVLEATEEIQSAVIDEENELAVTDSDGSKTVTGWCSDRAASDPRIESWTTAHAMEFFVNRINLLRWAKNNYVLQQYAWKPPERCKPPWKALQEPNEGTYLRGVKQHILNIVNRRITGKASTFLLYGPPGTSKTTIAESLAVEKNWDLISISPSDFVSDSLDRIEFRSRTIFRDLMNIDKAVIVFDELDSLLRNRSIFKKIPGTILEFVVPALLPKLQNFRDYVLEKDVAVFFLTNFYESVDLAIRRSGRIDAHLPILPYSREARLKVAKAQFAGRIKNPTLRNERWEMVDWVLGATPCNLTYQDVRSLVQTAVAIEQPLSRDELIASMDSLGVKPQVYTQREGCAREFCEFVARVFEKDTAKLVLNSANDGLTLLAEVLEETRKATGPAKSLLGTWIPVLEEISDSLTTQPTLAWG